MRLCSHVSRPTLSCSVFAAHGQMTAGKYEDTGGTQASSDGLTAAAVPAAAGQSPGGGRSQVRDYFTGSGQDRRCRLCGHVLRLNRQLSTSGMWRHMRVRHPELVQPAESTAGGRAEPLSSPGVAGSIWGELGAPAGDSGSGDGRRAEDSTTGPETDGFLKSLVMSGGHVWWSGLQVTGGQPSS